MSRHEGSAERRALLERAIGIAERARAEAARADTVAAREDYEFALKWLELVRRTSGEIAPKADPGLVELRQELPRAD